MTRIGTTLTGFNEIRQFWLSLARCMTKLKDEFILTHTHTHTYIYICVCVCVCVCIFSLQNKHTPLELSHHLTRDLVSYNWPNIAVQQLRILFCLRNVLYLDISLSIGYRNLHHSWFPLLELLATLHWIDNQSSYMTHMVLEGAGVCEFVDILVTFRRNWEWVTNVCVLFVTSI